MSQQSALEFLAHGQTPFFRLRLAPVAQPLPAATRAVFLGIPFDGGTTYQPGARLVGMDVVEVCPPLDHADITSHLAAHLLFEGLGLAACAPP